MPIAVVQPPTPARTMMAQPMPTTASPGPVMIYQQPGMPYQSQPGVTYQGAPGMVQTTMAPISRAAQLSRNPGVYLEQSRQMQAGMTMQGSNGPGYMMPNGEVGGCTTCTQTCQPKIGLLNRLRGMKSETISMPATSVPEMQIMPAPQGAPIMMPSGSLPPKIENDSSRAVEIAADRVADRTTERVINLATDRVVERAASKVVDRAGERVVDRAAEKVVDRAAERIADRYTDKVAASAADKMVERGTDKAALQAAQKIVERATDKVVNNATDRVMAQAADKLVERSTEKMVSQATEKVVNQATAQITERITDRVMSQSTDRMVAQATDRIVIQATDKAASQAADRLAAQGTDKLVAQATDRILAQATEKVIAQATERLVHDAEAKVIHDASQRVAERVPEKMPDKGMQVLVGKPMDDAPVLPTLPAKPVEQLEVKLPPKPPVKEASAAQPAMGSPMLPWVGDPHDGNAFSMPTPRPQPMMPSMPNMPVGMRMGMSPQMMPMIPSQGMMPMPTNMAPAMATDPALGQLLITLREAIGPGQRELAADQLSRYDWHANPAVLQALLAAAKEDPAGSVRACCVGVLVRNKASTPATLAVLQSMKEDKDERVRQNVAQALGEMGAGSPGNMPTIVPVSGPGR